MTQPIQKGLLALFASLLFGAAVAAEPEILAAQDAAVSDAGTGSDAIVLAASGAPPTSTPAQPAPAAPPSESAAEPEAEAAPASEPEPQVPNDSEKKVWLWLMVIVIVAAVVWLFSRNKPKSNPPK